MKLIARPRALFILVLLLVPFHLPPLKLPPLLCLDPNLDRKPKSHTKLLAFAGVQYLGDHVTGIFFLVQRG